MFLLATNEDYKLLETMNKALADKYKEMATVAQGFSQQSKEIEQRCMDLAG